MERGTIANGFLVVIGGLLLWSVPARADGITPPLPCGSSDCLTVFNAAGAPVYRVSATESQEKSDPGQLFFIDVEGLANGDMADSPTFLLDPNGKISDAFGVAPKSQDNKKDDKDNKEPVLGFISDPLGFDGKVSDICKEFTCLPEGTGGPFDATKYLSDDFLKDHKGYTAIFTSDSEVPEPATAGLFFGLGALGLCVWKRRRTIA